MTIEEINALTLESVQSELESRILVGKEEGHVVSQEELEAEFVVYKNELIAIEEARIEAERIAEEERLAAIEAARLAEEARKEDIQSRLSALKDKNHAHAVLHPDIPNAALFIKQKIEENEDHAEAESLLSLLEAKDAELQAAIEAEKYQEQRKSEYPSIEEVIHVIMDHGIGSQEFQQLQSARAAIKAKYPKP